MEGKLLSTLGKIAGTSGIALGVFLLIFQGVLEKDFLPKAGLTSEQAFSVILSLMVLTFGIAGTGILAWLVSRSVGPKNPVPGPALGVLAMLIAATIAAMVYLAESSAQVPQPNMSAKQCYRFDPRLDKESEALGPRTCFPGKVVYVKYWDATDYPGDAPKDRPNRAFQARGLTVDGGHIKWVEQNLLGVANELEEWGSENHYWASVIEDTGIGRGMNGFVLRRIDLQPIPVGQGKTQCDSADGTRTVFEFAFPNDAVARIRSGLKPSVGLRRLRVSCTQEVGFDPLPGPDFEDTQAPIIFAVSD